jgi:hypothetical protein
MFLVKSINICSQPYEKFRAYLPQTLLKGLEDPAIGPCHAPVESSKNFRHTPAFEKFQSSDIGTGGKIQLVDCTFFYEV